MKTNQQIVERGSTGSVSNYVHSLKSKNSKNGIKVAPEKNQQQIKEFMRNKGMTLRSRTTNWFWVYKSIIDKYGKKVGPIGIAIYCVLSRFCDQSITTVSYNTIAKLLNITKATVIKYILLLEHYRLLLKDKRKYKKNEYGSNIYYLAGGKLKNFGNKKGPGK